MKQARLYVLLHPVFLASLFTLLLNDAYLKELFHNAITGKLSDAAGIICLSLLVIVFFEKKLTVIFICAAFFTWWKSSLSSGFIAALNEFSGVPIYRVVDYTDIFVLPCTLIVYFIKPAPQMYQPFVLKIARMASASFCLFAFCRTSTIRYPQYNLRDHEIKINETFKSKLSKQEVLDKLKYLNIVYYLDSIRYYPLKKSELYFLDSDARMKQLPLPQNRTNPELFEKRTRSFYFIPELMVNGEKITDIEFYVYPRSGDEKSTVFVESIHASGGQYLYDENGISKLRKIKKELKKLFRDSP